MNNHDENQSAEPRHIPVLVAEVMSDLAPQIGETVLDATVGLGGHAAHLAMAVGTSGWLIGLDRDPAALAIAADTLKHQPAKISLLHSRFSALETVLTSLGIGCVDRILLDIGVSSMQMDVGERGFSFQRDGPWDMRMDPTRGDSAADYIATLDEADLADLIYQNGEERQSRRIAKRIVEARTISPINTTGQLAEIVAGAVRGRGKNHPATRVFQALRIAVNEELSELAAGLTAARKMLRPGGRLAVITFHSLEARQVKQTFRAWAAADAVTLVRKKVVKPTRAECLANRRARSAQLRVCERCASPV